MFLQSETGSGLHEEFVKNMITGSDNIEFYNTWTMESYTVKWQVGAEITCLIRIQGVSG
jgi:hypothetical protein